MMENSYQVAASSRRRSRASKNPVDRNICGSVSGANKHYAEGETLCGGCELASKERSRIYNAIKLGTGEFNKLPAYKWNLDEPLVEWRLLQTEELEDGLYISGPWYTKVRVPRDQVVGEIEVGGVYGIVFVNGRADYIVRGVGKHYAYLEIIRSSIVSWLDIIEGKYGK